MPEPRDAVLLDGGPGVVLAGHVAAAAGPAHVTVLRTGGLALFGGTAGSPERGWRSPALDAGEPRHDAAGCATAAGLHQGVNRRGLFVACTAAGPVARAALAAAVLARAGGVEEAEALLAAAATGLDGPDDVLLADPGGGLHLEVTPKGVRRLPPPPPGSAGGGLESVRATLRERAADGAVSAVAARLESGEPVLLVCLGPPRCSVFTRQWPGIPAASPLAGAAGLPPLLGRLAGALAAGPRRAGADALLAAAEAEILAEGEDAERMARIMDAAGDDHGAEVRRALAQSYAADLATGALERLLTGSGAVPGPTL